MVSQIKIKTIEEKNEILELLRNCSYPNSLTENHKRRLRRKCRNLVIENGALKFVKSSNTKLLFICTFEIDLIKEIFIIVLQPN